MKTLPIVNRIDEMLDRGAHLGDCFVVVQVDLFVLERAHEALGFGIVIRVAGAAHADLDFVVLQDRDVISSRVLDALIRMMDQSRMNSACLQRHLQSRQRQFRIDVARDGPADAAAAVGVQQHGQIDEVAPQTNISDVGHPKLIKTNPCDTCKPRLRTPVSYLSGLDTIATHPAM